MPSKPKAGCSATADRRRALEEEDYTHDIMIPAKRALVAQGGSSASVQVIIITSVIIMSLILLCFQRSMYNMHINKRFMFSHLLGSVLETLLPGMSTSTRVTLLR